MQQSIQLLNKETLKQCNSAITKMQARTVLQMEVIVNTTCDINSAIMIEQNRKVQHLSSVT